MNLVGYSDSEGSDNEVAPPPSKAKAPPKGFAKLVNPSTHKVKVNLAATTEKDDIEPEAPPAKKARTGGGGLNINAFLPAPKKTAQPRKGLGRGVNLKTGAEPAFSREPQSLSYGESEEPREIAEAIKKPEAPKPTQPEVKLATNGKRFMPLSVARNARKKKAVIKSTAAEAITTDLAPTAHSSKSPPAKPKVSLFSMEQADTSASNPAPSISEYTPMMIEDDEHEEDDENFEESYSEQQQAIPSASSQAPQTMNSLTSDLNLSEAEMRQLFGRKAGKGGKDMSDMSGINVVNFNTDAEYAANNDIIAKGETVTHNPVRGIAPGKHSLKQLMNTAITQKDALEEHFAKGKRNQGDARARYGW
jgi:hypothetical protein